MYKGGRSRAEGRKRGGGEDAGPLLCMDVRARWLPGGMMDMVVVVMLGMMLVSNNLVGDKAQMDRYVGG